MIELMLQEYAGMTLCATFSLSDPAAIRIKIAFCVILRFAWLVLPLPSITVVVKVCVLFSHTMKKDFLFVTGINM